MEVARQHAVMRILASAVLVLLVTFAHPARVASSPPPSPDASPLNVPPNQLKRIEGETQIVPPPSVKDQIRASRKGTTVTVVKVCISESGAVHLVKILKSSGYPEYDTRIVEGMRTWLYQPFEIRGKPVPVCSAVTFLYKDSQYTDSETPPQAKRRQASPPRRWTTVPLGSSESDRRYDKGVWARLGDWPKTTPEYTPFLEGVEQNVLRYWKPPRPGEKQSLRVDFELTVDPAGHLKNLDVKSSSGNDEFDRAAIRALKRTKRFAKPPVATDVDTGLFRFKVRLFVLSRDAPLELITPSANEPPLPEEDR
jgi:TonB family protein